ncbi:hypothetical protein LX16_0056 [Stackebrandtia albiflava]|uniref:S-adenosyl-l-methionine hydroxide adenosyltransferase n=1 Tax=Stackebrandtia albiflava TaxID=406432 RepID=A0A562VGZ3_9ACTN|nr:SAM-dependent chlorinase/fluorinase [Stackebrandtia albiflava]TWJ17140.1 hypothetical protein LX16_0056 [Stackebrandtia albiflava]
MPTYPIVSLTTDYGLADGFVAACHGVIAQWAPDTRVIDVSHLVPPGDIRRGALVLAQTVPFLPRGVHMAVVDPGVGTTRFPVAIEAGFGILVGPDNGLLMWAAEALGGVQRAVTLTDTRFHRHPVSHTFHGRDIFAPAAAVLSSGVAPADLGEPVKPNDLVRLPDPKVTVTDGEIVAEVMSVDRFGNLQLAADGRTLDGFGEGFEIAGRSAVRGDMFAAADPGAVVVLVDSAGKVAIAVNGGSAAEELEARAGDVLSLRAR